MEIPKNKSSLSATTKINIYLTYLFNLFCDYYYTFYRKTYTWQCKLYVYLATRARRRDLSFFDLTSRTVDGLELNIHKAVLGKNLQNITHVSDIYEESLRAAIFKQSSGVCDLFDSSSTRVDTKTSPDYTFEDRTEDITYHLRFFAAYYPHSCEDLKQFLEELNFDTAKPLNLTFRLENSGRTYYLVIDLKNAKNMLCDKKFAFGEIDFGQETQNELI